MADELTGPGWLQVFRNKEQIIELQQSERAAVDQLAAAESRQVEATAAQSSAEGALQRAEGELAGVTANAVKMYKQVSHLPSFLQVRPNVQTKI